MIGNPEAVAPRPSELRSIIIALAIPIGLIGIGAIVVFGPYLWSSVKYHPLRQQTFREIVRPTAQWVHSYHAQNGRLPTNEELATFARTNSMKHAAWIYDSRLKWPELAYHPWREGVDFVITVPLPPAWKLYYNSWDHSEWQTRWNGWLD